MRRTTAVALAGDLIRLGLAATVGAILLAGYATYRIWEQGARDEQRPAGAIVALGAAQYNGAPSPVFAARLDHAVSLYLAGLAPYLVVTGGKADGDRWTEAAVARVYALERGVPDGAILVEDRGRTTLESLEAVAEVLRAQGIRDAIFVSDRTHMLRVIRIVTKSSRPCHRATSGVSVVCQSSGNCPGSGCHTRLLRAPRRP